MTACNLLARPTNGSRKVKALLRANVLVSDDGFTLTEHPLHLVISTIWLLSMSESLQWELSGGSWSHARRGSYYRNLVSPLYGFRPDQPYFGLGTFPCTGPE